MNVFLRGINIWDIFNSPISRAICIHFLFCHFKDNLHKAFFISATQQSVVGLFSGQTDLVNHPLVASESSSGFREVLLFPSFGRFSRQMPACQAVEGDLVCAEDLVVREITFANKHSGVPGLSLFGLA
ncbi:hypothetical protein AB205_0099820 [Aquarana catesbeiana]|uniref:Uncharacterized protein n=1 Tax=Aquarana catesbeiana TaxID=8400 RepID=A0A2G9S0G8_AQUCT|nr:hypothetical protein AB205_0099820 [Aquarana catesbeiana]